MPLSLLLGACTAEPISIGSDDEALVPPTDNPMCPGGIVPNGVTATTQAGIDALAGCTEIAGDLNLISFVGMDLSPLSELRLVRGNMDVGGWDNETRRGREVFLHGLEKLEEVNNLTLNYVMDSDLSALANLRRIGAQSGSPNAQGLFWIVYCDGLRDLSGLDALTVFSELIIEANEQLTTLSGLQPPASMRSVQVSGSRSLVLKDISALAPLRSIDDVFGIDHTGVINLEGLQLETVGVLRLRGNASLTNADSLSSLTSLEGLIVSENDQLEEFPPLDGVHDVRRVSIANNGRLRSAPSFYGTSGGPSISFGYSGGGIPLGPSTEPGSIPRLLSPNQSLGFDLYEVARNPALTRVWSPMVGRAGNVVIHGNASLEVVDFPNADFLNGLILHDNAVLRAFSMGGGSRVVDLWVTSNPQLPTAFFENLTTMSSKISDNLPSSAP